MNDAASAVLLAVAAELAKLAKDKMPKLQQGESVVREWYEGGIYFRESSYADEIFRCQYDFGLRKCHRMKVTRGESNV